MSVPQICTRQLTGRGKKVALGDCQQASGKAEKNLTNPKLFAGLGFE
jgi:hypothetical protein